MSSTLHFDRFVVRRAADLTDKQAHRLMVFAALDDIVGCNRPSWQRTSPQTARLLGIDPAFTSLLHAYLDYRRAKIVTPERGIRPHNNNAEVYRLRDGAGLDLVSLGSSQKDEERLAGLLNQAVVSKLRVDPPVIIGIERRIGRACGVAWDSLCNVYARQRNAQAVAA